MIVTARTARSFAVISDLHLGRPGAPLACAIPEDDLMESMAALRARHDLTIVNGDLFDLERGVLPFAFRHELRLIEHHYVRALAQFVGPDVVWTCGNHDRLLYSDGRAAEFVEVVTARGTFRVEHGDRFNAPIKRLRPFTSLVTWASGRAAAFEVSRPIYRLMHALDLALAGSTVAPDEPVAQAAANWLERASPYAGLVIGHTHAAVVRPVGVGRLLVNPGASSDAPQAASIDAVAGTVTLERWSGGVWSPWFTQPLPASAGVRGPARATPGAARRRGAPA